MGICRFSFRDSLESLLHHFFYDSEGHTYCTDDMHLESRYQWFFRENTYKYSTVPYSRRFGNEHSHL